MQLVTSSPSRIAAAGIAAIAALSIAACSPPHEQPSTEKIDTATSQNPDSLAGGDHLAGQTAVASATNVADAAKASTTAPATSTAAASADGTPMFNNCGQTGLQRPTSLNLDCNGGKERLEDIVWDQWTEAGATGTATQITVDPDRVVEGAQVTLGAPQEVDGDLVFTVISVDGVTVNPENN